MSELSHGGTVLAGTGATGDPCIAGASRRPVVGMAQRTCPQTEPVYALTSRATHSTWAVIGKQSNARSPASR